MVSPLPLVSPAPTLVPVLPRLTDDERRLPAMSAEADGFPDGWTVRRVPRASGEGRADNVFYSPDLELRFSSRPAAERYVDCLERAGGCEASAAELYKKEKTARRKSPARKTDSKSGGRGNSSSRKPTCRACPNLAMSSCIAGTLGLCKDCGPKCTIEGCTNAEFRSGLCRRHCGVQRGIKTGEDGAEGTHAGTNKGGAGRGSGSRGRHCHVQEGSGKGDEGDEVVLVRKNDDSSTYSDITSQTRAAILPGSIKEQVRALLPRRGDGIKGMKARKIAKRVKGFLGACRGVSVDEVLKSNFPGEIEAELQKGKFRYFLRSTEPRVLNGQRVSARQGHPADTTAGGKGGFGSEGGNRKSEDGETRDEEEIGTIRLSPVQAKQTKFPLGCEVLYGYERGNGSSTAVVKLGAILSVRVSLKGDFRYEVGSKASEDYEGGDTDKVMKREQFLAYAPMTPVYLRSASGLGEKREGTVLLASRAGGSPSEMYQYVVLTSRDDGERIIEYDVAPGCLSFRAHAIRGEAACDKWVIGGGRVKEEVDLVSEAPRVKIEAESSSDDDISASEECESSSAERSPNLGHVRKALGKYAEAEAIDSEAGHKSDDESFLANTRNSGKAALKKKKRSKKKKHKKHKEKKRSKDQNADAEQVEPTAKRARLSSYGQEDTHGSRMDDNPQSEERTMTETPEMEQKSRQKGLEKELDEAVAVKALSQPARDEEEKYVDELTGILGLLKSGGRKGPYSFNALKELVKLKAPFAYMCQSGEFVSSEVMFRSFICMLYAKRFRDWQVIGWWIGDEDFTIDDPFMRSTRMYNAIYGERVYNELVDRMSGVVGVDTDIHEVKEKLEFLITDGGLPKEINDWSFDEYMGVTMFIMYYPDKNLVALIRYHMPFPIGYADGTVPEGVNVVHGAKSTKIKVPKKGNSICNYIGTEKVAMMFYVCVWLIKSRKSWENGKAAFASPGKYGIAKTFYHFLILREIDGSKKTEKEIRRNMVGESHQVKGWMGMQDFITWPQITAIVGAILKGNDSFAKLVEWHGETFPGEEFPNGIQGCHILCPRTQFIELPHEELGVETKNGYKLTKVSSAWCASPLHIVPGDQVLNEAHKACPGRIIWETRELTTITRVMASLCNCMNLPGNALKAECLRVTRVKPEDVKEKSQEIKSSLAAKGTTGTESSGLSEDPSDSEDASSEEESSDE